MKNTNKMIMNSFKLVIINVASIFFHIHVTRASYAKPGCREKCGNVTILYPYGIGEDCSLNKWFEVLCSGSSQNPTLRFVYKQKFMIEEISKESIRVYGQSRINCNTYNYSEEFQLEEPFSYSHKKTCYVASGCNISATFQWALSKNSSVETKCTSSCYPSIPFAKYVIDCNGSNGCCILSNPVDNRAYSFQMNSSDNAAKCSYASIVDKNSRLQVFPGLSTSYGLPFTLNWVIASTTCHRAHERGDCLCGNNSYCIDSIKGLGYNCRCKKGHEGNPYLPYGCQDIREGISSPHHKPKYALLVTPESVIGLLAFGIITYWAYRILDKIKKKMIKRKFYRRNGGHLLKQQISDNKSCVMKIKVYSSEEMEKATQSFSQRRFLGKGGQGTVYKGLFPDGTIVAIKTSNVVDKDHIARFVNEIFILAQINHRNIVKLLGCCLEYEVPILVYEYLANGTLSQHLHDGAQVSKFSWKDRMRIAREVAGALAYLHSYATPPIFHRDIKPHNILLDENYKAVVSDFGLSRSVPLSRTHVTTQFDGTLGYLDPEYFASGQLTAKSDVYAFGVVLVELLTRKKPVSSTKSGEGLVQQFQYLMKHDRVHEMLDKQVVQEACTDDVLRVTELANRCMKNNGKKRPSMKDVVVDLDILKLVQVEHTHICSSVNNIE